MSTFFTCLQVMSVLTVIGHWYVVYSRNNPTMLKQWLDKRRLARRIAERRALGWTVKVDPNGLWYIGVEPIPTTAAE